MLSLLKNSNKIYINLVAFIIVISLFVTGYKPAFTIAMIAFFLYGILDYYKQQRLLRITVDKSVLKGIGYFFASIIIASCLTLNFENLDCAIELIYLSLPFWMLLYLGAKEDIWIGIETGLFAAMFIGCLISFYQFLFMGIGRPNGVFVNVNLWAAAISMLLPVMIFFASNNFNANLKKEKKFVLILMILSLALTQTRGALIATIIIALIYFYYIGGYKLLKQYKIFILSILLLFFISGLYMLGNNNIVRDYESERLYGWQGSIAMWQDHKIYGVGLANWDKSYAKQYKPILAKNDLMHAHNFYLQFLSTTGLIGITGIAVMLLRLASYLLKRIKINSKDYLAIAVLASIGIFLIHGFVDAVFFIKPITRIFWLVIALAFLNYSNNMDN